jgi:hypothetical protein
MRVIAATDEHGLDGIMRRAGPASESLFEGKAPADTPLPGEDRVIALGVVLLIVGFLAKIAILWTVGIILVVVGVVLALLGMMGRAVGGRSHYY